MNEVDELLERQDGVISRRQALDRGWSRVDVARMLRRREWTQVHPGVYVNHTGPPTWRQRAWAAVLACWPAALGGWAAVRAHEGPGRRRHDDAEPIEVIVRHGRHPAALAGVRVRSTRRFAEAVQVGLSPPRQRYDDAIVELADRARDELSLVAVLADACGSRRTTADRLLARASTMTRLSQRDLVVAVLADVAAGTCSVLEHAYLVRVERAHGLPPGERQVPAVDADGRPMLRDVVHGGGRPRWQQVVELDGRLFHDSATARDRDLERDLDTALGGADTVRLGYGQVLGRPCRTAAKLGALFQLRGWAGAPTACSQCRPADGRGSARIG
ncbi:type IV toxin-antitoxin system AbiEi family antitoxin domain-containing protein [Nocardioides nitrophenolicus]|uniref:type IV toxin-antitoxin system AbiEi family antitoxin domain-containing protein n=1 Tax=Nocardioides nitrophenolicus TaxID=60489 RepID=UPI00195902E5|nr:type IV toxin-antitoxin system AbiEi family antitoxin domain-containing protein [Nocardioides nitrophenolicus]MBM7517352.1 hypothetical protein [Nocardioides nitrophenolicus]